MSEGNPETGRITRIDQEGKKQVRVLETQDTGQVLTGKSIRIRRPVHEALLRQLKPVKKVIGIPAHHQATVVVDETAKKGHTTDR